MNIDSSVNLEMNLVECCWWLCWWAILSLSSFGRSSR